MGAWAVEDYSTPPKDTVAEVLALLETKIETYTTETIQLCTVLKQGSQYIGLLIMGTAGS